MKKLYLVISAAAVIAAMGFAAWKYSNSGEASSEDTAPSKRTAQQATASDTPLLSDGQVIIMPPDMAAADDAQPSPTTGGDGFILPPDDSRIRSAADGDVPSTTPAFVIPPSMP